jgi:RHS repeat-associated protein
MKPARPSKAWTGHPCEFENGKVGHPPTSTTHQYTWDAEGDMLTIDNGISSGVCLTYDALGRMVEQGTGTSCSTHTQIVYAPGGVKLALMSGQTLQKAFVPLTGGATAAYNASGLLYFRHADWSGSSRLSSKPNRTLWYDTAYAPYGENYAGKTGSGGAVDLNFTGQNQDTASWLYDFLFREYNPTQGRWMSPDPAGFAAVDPANPQSWNRYGYVMNDPSNAVDTTSSALHRVFRNAASSTSAVSVCRSAGGSPADLAQCLFDSRKHTQKIMNKDYTPKSVAFSSFAALQAQVEPLAFRQAGQLVDTRITTETTANGQKVVTSCFFDTAGGTRSACSGFYTGFGWGDFWQWAGIQGPPSMSPGASGFGTIQAMGVFNFGDPSEFGNPFFNPPEGGDSNGDSGGSGGSTPIPPDCLLCSVE